jgi:hypothetical protein
LRVCPFKNWLTGHRWSLSIFIGKLWKVHLCLTACITGLNLSVGVQRTGQTG